MRGWYSRGHHDGPQALNTHTYHTTHKMSKSKSKKELFQGVSELLPECKPHQIFLFLVLRLPGLLRSEGDDLPFPLEVAPGPAPRPPPAGWLPFGDDRLCVGLA